MRSRRIVLITALALAAAGCGTSAPTVPPPTETRTLEIAPQYRDTLEPSDDKSSLTIR